MLDQFNKRLCALLLVITFSTVQADDRDEREIIDSLRQLGLKELMNVSIMDVEATSAAKKQQSLANTATALFVITQEDLRRAGVNSLPEALRMVPGLQVARIDANKWAISARGLNERFASKLLVLIDGRSVYTPLRSEVYWEVQDTLIENIDHIEIVRGPGGSLWGANAVNGIINIITKSAKDTQGNLLTSELGTNGNWIGTRHGGVFADSKGHYRVYAKYFKQNNFANPNDREEKRDEWEMNRAGFRMDWQPSLEDNLTVQGDIYDGNISQTLNLTYPESRQIFETIEVSGLNVLARWQRFLPNDADMILQGYYDFTRRDEVLLGEVRHTFDLDFQHRWWLNEHNELIWGLGFRQTRDDLDGSSTIDYEPSRRHDNLFSAFLQNEMSIIPERLRLTLGSKFEHNDYTGLEFQPTIRLLVTPNERQSFWAAISRAVRTPSRTDENGLVTSTIGKNVAKFIGNQDIKSETLIAYELGYRLAPSTQFFLDSTLFFNRYDYLRTSEFQTFRPPSTLLFVFDNLMEGEIYGLELAAHWHPRDKWKLIAAYSYLQQELHIKPDSKDSQAEHQEGSTPHHQFNLRSLINLSDRWEFDSTWYYVDNVPTYDVNNYIRLDLRLNWRATPNLELSLGARNLLDNQHREFGGGSGIKASEIERGVYGQLRWQF